MESPNRYELDNQTGENHEGPVANTPVRRLTAKSIIGSKIENPDGESLGSVKNLMIDLNKGEIEYAILQFSGLLGVGEKLFAVPWSEFRLEPSREVFLLNRDRDYLKKAPGFDEDHWPDTNAHYYSESTNYWGTEQEAIYPKGNILI